MQYERLELTWLLCISHYMLYMHAVMRAVLRGLDVRWFGVCVVYSVWCAPRAYLGITISYCLVVGGCWLVVTVRCVLCMVPSLLFAIYYRRPRCDVLHCIVHALCASQCLGCAVSCFVLEAHMYYLLDGVYVLGRLLILFCLI